MEQSQAPKGSILIAHFADLHLRDTQYATVRRGIDFYEAALRGFELACAKADILVLGGDIFDQPRPSPRVIGQLMHLDQMLVIRGKKCLAVTGNHDWCNPTWLATLFPGGTDREAGIIPLDDEVYEFHGFKFVGVRQRSAEVFRRDMAEIEAQVRKADVVLFHGLVSEIVPFYAGRQDPLTYKEFPVSKNNKAWLLGDIHLQGYGTTDRPGGGKCLMGYPGSLEMYSASEPVNKSMPLIRLSKDEAVLEDNLPLRIRPFITGVVQSEEDLEDLMKQIEPVADQHPVVSVDFDRGLPQTINRLHSMLDAQRAVIRCYPLPTIKVNAAREDDDGEEELGMEHFISKRFSDSEDLCRVALDLLVRGDTDANNIISDFIEAQLAATGVRED
jgi:DNA repair exonuclease SbcCD nuclease subunit